MQKASCAPKGYSRVRIGNHSTTLRSATAIPTTPSRLARATSARSPKKYPNIKVMVYLSVDLSGVGHPDWTLDDSHPQNVDKWGNNGLDAYRKVSNQKRFKGHL